MTKATNPFTRAYFELKSLGAPVFVHVDYEEGFDVSAEESNSSEWLNYFSQDPRWIFGMHPALVHVLDKHGLYAEWVNPAHTRIYHISGATWEEVEA